MTLYRQLLIWMMVVFFVLITSVFMIQFSTIRDFVREQQSTEMDNAISAVGLALSPYLEANDKVAAETVIHAAFDSSYYSEIHLTLFNDQSEIAFSYPPETFGVPTWFQTIVKLEPITRSTTLTGSWLQLASLKIVSNTANAYQQLWQASKQLLWGFGLSFLLAMTILSIILSKVLNPLKAIQQRAKRMANNIFDKPLPVPKIRELNDMVVAFNHMSAQLDIHFKQQAQEADKLRVRAFQDPVSKLANRSYLMTQLDSWMSQSSEGGIALLKVDLIEDTYDNIGYEAGDRLVQKLATRLKELATDEFTLSRLSQSEFMLVAPNTSREELITLGRLLLSMTAELHSDPLGVAPTPGAVGLVMRRKKDDLTSLLAQADNALSQAKQQTKEQLMMFDADTNNQPLSGALGKQQWKALVDEAIANQLFKFKLQKAVNQQNEVIHHEVYAYIQKGNTTYSASQFLGAIEQLNAGVSMDIHIINELFTRLKNGSINGKIAINITESSVNDTGFMRWIANKLEASPSLSTQITFELPEICFIKRANNTKLLCEIIHQNGFTFGIDNFGHNFSSTGYLNEYRPSHVKLDFAYTHQIDNQIKTDVLASITQTANNLSIMTIATRVETEHQKKKLEQLMVRAFQGYVVDRSQNLAQGTENSETTV